MKKLIILCFLVVAFCTTKAQVNWIYNLPEAQIKSLSENKLILLDFWASWCQPCRKMDEKLWNSPEIKMVADKFIPLKVDIDVQQDLAIKYGIKAIPTVVLMTANGEVIWKKTDFTSAVPYLKVLQDIPDDIIVVNETLAPIMNKESDIAAYIKVGKAFQEIGVTLPNKTLKVAFLRWSNSYYKLAKKASGATDLVKQAELLTVLNDAYRGNAKKARKKLAKLNISVANTELLELAQFIKAYCFKCEGELTELDKMKDEFTNEKYIAQLKQ